MIIREEHIRRLVRTKLEETLRKSVRAKAKSKKRQSSDNTGTQGSLEGIKYTSVPNNQAAQIALSEFSTWKNGKLKEDEKEAYPILKKYWDGLGGWPESRWNPTGTAWSAAFISYCMKKAGDNFYDSAAHTTYATKALENRNKLLKDSKSLSGVQHVLFLKGEAQPEIGDVMFYVREGNLEGWMSGGGGRSKSHTDIFIGGGKGIGGNLSNTCSKTKAMGKHTAIIKKIKI